MTNVTPFPKDVDLQQKAMDLNHQQVTMQTMVQKESISLAHTSHFLRTVVWAVCTVSVTWLITTTAVQIAGLLLK